MPSESPEPRVRVHVLGRFLVEVDGEALALSPRGKRKPLELLKVLIALEGAQASVAEITETLWPDAEGDKGYRTFSITLNRLRGLVGHDAVRLQGGRLSLNADLCWVDAFHFSKLVADAATEAGVDRVADLAGGAVALYRGPFLPGEFDLPEVLSARDRLHGQFLRLVETCGDRLAAVNADRGMILYRRGIETDPLAESFYLRLMEQLNRQGRATEAITLYQRAERLFESSLGSRPSPQLIALAEHIQQAQRGGGVYEPSAAPATLPASTASTVPPGGGRRPASATGERLRATAVFCDIAGYTSLSEREDPEVVEDILSAFRATATRIMERHGGIVNQFVGDEVVALFGVVQAHEDDAARAVRATLDLHMAVEREGRQHGIRFPLRLHTGINTGLMVVKPQGGPDGTYRVNGDALNTAARLRSMAPAGEIWVGPEVATAVQAYVTL
ncbi:MAG TPA: BTAD domain-containing putative transcriptional regulator, partial [bacterium]